MQKRSLLFRAPVLCAAGYGTHSRQLLRGLLASGMFDIGVQPIAWGNTAFLYDETDQFLKVIRELGTKGELDARRGKKYDVSVQVTIPNEFQKLADIDIGVTAGIEVDRTSPTWIQKINETVDLVVVPSKHSFRTLAEIAYKDSTGNTLRVNKPVVVVPEGVDTSVFNEDPLTDEEVSRFSFEAPFNFVFVGLGLDKGIGEDRKNVSLLVKWFCERFKDDERVGLVLKTSLVNGSLLDQAAVIRRITEIKRMTGCGKFPRIQLVHGRLTDRELASLYKNDRVKAFVTLAAGEGYGLPTLEAAACGLPVMATDWSGHLDFLCIDGRRRFIPVEFDLKDIPQAAVWPGVMEAGSRWAYPREEDTKTKMWRLFHSYARPKEWASELGAHVRDKFEVSKTSLGFANLVVDFLDKSPKVNAKKPHSELATIVKQKLNIQPGDKTILFTMPMSAGDVFIATGVVASLKQQFPDHKLFFATQECYAPILRDNPDITQIVQFESWMADVPFCERIFTEVRAPNLVIQTIQANWVKGGKGRRLADEMAFQSGVEFGQPRIFKEPIDGLPDRFILLQPGSGKGQWEARAYLHWQEVVENVARISGLPIVQVGALDDPKYEKTIDFRGKTTYNQLAYAVSKAACLVSIDTVSVHMAAAFGVPHVAIYGSSYANSTGPARPSSKLGNKLVVIDAPKSVLIETPTRYTCEKACYRYQCEIDKDHPCINEIAPAQIVDAVLDIVGSPRAVGDHKAHHPTIGGYTTTLDCEKGAYPYTESIRSLLGFCDEVVVVDGGSTDGTRDKLEELAKQDSRVKIYDRNFDWTEPGMDGAQKAFARALCASEYLWQQDSDEVVHEDDYDKIKRLAKRFPRSAQLMHLPVVELWAGAKSLRTDRHCWKFRFSQNKFHITHGINKHARLIDEKTGKTYARKGMSDGCEYIGALDGEFIPHVGFWNEDLELLRRHDPIEYGRRMNAIFQEIPSVYHFSWASPINKIKLFKSTWNRLWSLLYNDPSPEDRFPGVDPNDEESIMAAAREVARRGGEHGEAVVIPLERSLPAIVEEFVKRIPEFG